MHGENAIATLQHAKPENLTCNIRHASRDEFFVAPRHNGIDKFDRCVGDPDVLAPNEKYPAFDAANAIRANDEILYLVSNSGNKKGAEYLQHQLGDTATVRLLEGGISICT